MAYGDFKDLTRRRASDKILRDKAFNIVKNPKYDGYQRGLASMVYKSFWWKFSGSSIKNENISNKRPLDLARAAKVSDRRRELAEELHKPIIRKFNKRNVQSPFMDNSWGADLADMQLIRKFNKEFRFLLCVLEIYSKYAWVIPLKDKKGTTITNAFQKILKESNRREAKSKGRKPNKIWLDKKAVNFIKINEIMARKKWHKNVFNT